MEAISLPCSETFYQFHKPLSMRYDYSPTDTSAQSRKDQRSGQTADMAEEKVMGPLFRFRSLRWMYILSIASIVEYAVHRRSTGRARRLTRRLLKQNKPVQVELGAKAPRPGWITAHFESGADLTLDLTKSLPFPDSSVDKVYSSHILDHPYYEDAF